MAVKKLQKKKKYILNEYFVKKLEEDMILITTRHGGWAKLSNKEFKSFKLKKIEDNLFKKLEKAGVILTENNRERIKDNFKTSNCRLFAPPSFHIVAITERCNLNCIYCFRNEKPIESDMDEKTADKVLDFIFSIPGKSHTILITGGEALLNWKIFKKIYYDSKKRAEKQNKKITIAMMTNYTLMNEEIAEELIKMNKGNLGVISGSLDGPQKINDKNRMYHDGRGSYNDVIKWLQYFKSKNIKCNVMPAFSKYSFEYSPKEIIDEFVRLDQTAVYVKHTRLIGRAKINKRQFVTNPEEFFNYWKEAVEYCIKLCKQGTFIIERRATELASNILYQDRPRGNCEFGRPCGAGLNILSYNPDGSIYPCDCIRAAPELKLGNVYEDTFRTIRAKALSFAAITSDVSPECFTCPLIHYCNTCLSDNIQQDSLYPNPPYNPECEFKKRAYYYLFKKIINGEDVDILKKWINTIVYSKNKESHKSNEINPV